MGLKFSLSDLLVLKAIPKIHYLMNTLDWHRLFVSFWGSVSFIGLGVAMVIFGSTLLDIASHLSVGVGILALMFTCRAVGAGIGSVGSGVIMDKFADYHFTTMIAILLASIATTAVIPFSIHIAMFAVLMILNGMAIGSLDNGIHAILMKLWGDKSGPCMQILHFCFAFGAFLAPLIAKHYISDEQEPDDGGASNENATALLCDSFFNVTSDITSGFEFSMNGYTPNVNETDCFELLYDVCSNFSSGITYSYSNTDTAVTNCSQEFNITSSNSELTDTSRFKYAYLIASTLFILPLIVFTYYALRYELLSKSCCRRREIEPQILNQEDKDEEIEEEESAQPKSEPKPKQPTSRVTVVYTVILFTLLFCFLFIYVGMEVSFGSLIFTVAVKSELNFEKQQAAVLQSVFWGTFAFTRLVSVSLVLLKVRSSVMICGNLSGSLIASIIMVFYPHNATAIWIGTAVLGMSYASIFPTTMTWMSENAKATGKATAVLNTAGTVGDLTIPTAFTALIAQVSPDSLIYGTFVGIVISICIVSALFLIACLQRRRTQSKTVTLNNGELKSSSSSSNAQYLRLQEDLSEDNNEEESIFEETIHGQ